MALATKVRPLPSEAMVDEAEVDHVAIADLHLDVLTWLEGKPRGYQRPLDQPRIEKYAKNFDPHLIGAVTLNRRRDGTLWILDGQHRVAVLSAIGKSVVLAYIYDGLTPEEEAATYYRLNTDRKAPNMWNKFGARVRANDPVAQAILRIAGDAGFKVGTSDRSLGSIAAVNTLETIYKREGGPRLLRQTLDVISRIWPTDVVARDGTFVRGLALFISTWDRAYEYVGVHEEAIDWKRFDDIFSKLPATQITKAVRQFEMEYGADSGHNSSSYGMVFRQIYNGKSNFKHRLEGKIAYTTSSGNVKRIGSRRSAQ